MIMWQGIFLSLITLWLGSLAVGVFFFLIGVAFKYLVSPAVLLW